MQADILIIAQPNVIYLTKITTHLHNIKVENIGNYINRGKKMQYCL